MISSNQRQPLDALAGSTEGLNYQKKNTKQEMPVAYGSRSNQCSPFSKQCINDFFIELPLFIFSSSQQCQNSGNTRKRSTLIINST